MQTRPEQNRTEQKPQAPLKTCLVARRTEEEEVGRVEVGVEVEVEVGRRFPAGALGGGEREAGGGRAVRWWRSEGGGDLWMWMWM